MTGAALNRGGSRQDHETPADFMSAVRQRFGPIVYDLAALRSNRKADLFLSPDVDSLTVQWHTLLRGTYWLNPPFSNIAPWAEKVDWESRSGAKILFLTPASVGSNWFAQSIFNKAKVLFLNGRLTFVGSKDPYPKDCILSVFGIEQPGFEVWRWK